MPAVERRDEVEKAQDALHRAEQAIAAAQRERDEADAALDRALSELGWRRAFGGFDAKLYERGGAGHLVGRDQLLAALEAERRGGA